MYYRLEKLLHQSEHFLNVQILKFLPGEVFLISFVWFGFMASQQLLATQCLILFLHIYKIYD